MPGADTDVTSYARFEQACSVEQSYFAAAAETLGTELVIKPYVSLPRAHGNSPALTLDFVIKPQTSRDVSLTRACERQIG